MKRSQRRRKFESGLMMPVRQCTSASGPAPCRGTGLGPTESSAASASTVTRRGSGIATVALSPAPLRAGKLLPPLLRLSIWRHRLTPAPPAARCCSS